MIIDDDQKSVLTHIRPHKFSVEMSRAHSPASESNYY